MKRNERLVLIYCEIGRKTLVFSDTKCIPWGKRGVIDSKWIRANFGKEVNQIWIEDLEISQKSKGLEERIFEEFPVDDKKNFVCDIVFLKNATEIPDIMEWKHFDYKDGYKLLPYLSGLHKGLFTQG